MSKETLYQYFYTIYLKFITKDEYLGTLYISEVLKSLCVSEILKFYKLQFSHLILYKVYWGIFLTHANLRFEMKLKRRWYISYSYAYVCCKIFERYMTYAAGTLLLRGIMTLNRAFSFTRRSQPAQLSILYWPRSDSSRGKTWAYPSSLRKAHLLVYSHRQEIISTSISIL